MGSIPAKIIYRFINMKNIAIITARGGSKGLPRKNILPLLGVPLITYTIRAAQCSNIFERIYVSTEDDEIKNIALKENVSIINRPMVLAQDTSSSIDVIEHALQEINYHGFAENFFLLQPTSPLRNAEHIQEAWGEFEAKQLCSLASVSASTHSPYKVLVKKDQCVSPLFQDWNILTLPRQNLPKTYQLNGAIYISKIKEFLEKKSLFLPPFSFYEMDSISSIDIDDKLDFDFVEYLLSKIK